MRIAEAEHPKREHRGMLAGAVPADMAVVDTAAADTAVAAAEDRPEGHRGRVAAADREGRLHRNSHRAVGSAHRPNCPYPKDRFPRQWNRQSSSVLALVVAHVHTVPPNRWLPVVVDYVLVLLCERKKKRVLV